MYGESPNMGRRTHQYVDILSRPYRAFVETWQDEGGIPVADWIVTDPVAGVAWSRGASGAMLRATSTPNASNFCQLVSRERWIFAPDTYAVNMILQRSYLEFELKLTDVANMENANCFFGLTTGTGDYRTADNIIGFGLASDVLQSITDNGGAETTTTNFDETLTAWNKLGIEAYAGHVRFYVNEKMKADHATNLPDYPLYINFYLEAEAGGAATIELGIIRPWWFDRVL